MSKITFPHGRIPRPFFFVIFVFFCLFSVQKTYMIHIPDALRIGMTERRPT